MDNYSETATSSSSCPCGFLNYLLSFGGKSTDSGDIHHQSRSILLQENHQQQDHRRQEIWILPKKMRNLIKSLKRVGTKKSKCCKSFKYDLEGYQLNFDRQVEEEYGATAFVFSSRFAPPASSFTSDHHMKTC